MTEKLAMVKCPVCGMGYVKGLDKDEKEHRHFHDPIANGVRARPLSSDQVVWKRCGETITAVTAHSPVSQRKRAERAARAANAEMHYNGGIYCATEAPDDRDIHLFLYYVRNRIVGLAIFEKRQNVWWCTWSSKGKRQPKKLSDHPAVWSVGFIWVHMKHRRRGIARRLFQEGIAHLGVERSLVGWCTPFSQDGEALVRSLYPQGFLIAK